jgi:hypothetical protein
MNKGVQSEPLYSFKLLLLKGTKKKMNKGVLIAPLYSFSTYTLPLTLPPQSKKKGKIIVAERNQKKKPQIPCPT